MDKVPEVAGTGSLPAESEARAAAFEDVASDEDADRSSVVGPAVSEVETGARDAVGAGELSPDASAGLTV